MNELERIKKEKIIAIIRNLSPAETLLTADALYEGGIRVLEVTFSQKKPPQETAVIISSLVRRFQHKMLIGAGTVMTPEQLAAAHQAGARFILSPDCDTGIIRAVKKAGLISIPGALSPTEIAAAWRAGADLVKLFPAEALGLAYIKALQGPLGHIPLSAVGGVNLDNIRDFFSAGVCSVGIGSNIVDVNAVRQENYLQITQTARAYVAAVQDKGEV